MMGTYDFDDKMDARIDRKENRNRCLDYCKRIALKNY